MTAATRKRKPRADVDDGPVYEARIHPDLREQAVPVESLSEFYKNPNEGDDEEVAASLRRNGQYKAITVNKGTKTGRPDEVLCGNTTYRAARYILNWPDIAVEFIDVGEHAARRIVAVDNESAKKAKTNKAVMVDLLGPIKDDLVGTSVTPEEFAKMVGDDDPDLGHDDEEDPVWGVIVTCRDEAQQLDLLERLADEGHDVRAMVR